MVAISKGKREIGDMTFERFYNGKNCESHKLI